MTHAVFLFKTNSCVIWMLNKNDLFIRSLLQDAVLDEYALAHAIGWWAKAIMIRNEPFLWCLSIVFEFAEVSNFWGSRAHT